jgi:protein-disulfide isomerase
MLLTEEFLKNLMALMVVPFVLAACAPSASQLKKVMEDNPDIIFSVIEKHPDQFLQTVNKAARAAREQEDAKRVQDEAKSRDEEFANPKKPEIDAKRAIWGKNDAPITIVMYDDFQCPFCKRGHETIAQVMKEYGDKVRLVYKNLPLEFHPKAMPAAKYFEAVAMQGSDKAFKFYDEVFNNQESLVQDGEKFLDNAAKKVGADLAKVKKDVKSDEVKKRIDADTAEARQFGFSGTPGFLINGVSLKGAYPFEEFKSIIDRQLGGGAPKKEEKK